MEVRAIGKATVARIGEELTKEVARILLADVYKRQAVAGNPSIEQSVAEPPKRQLFFEQINAEPLDSLIARLTATPLHKRLWRRLHHQAHRVKLRLRHLVRG